MAAALSARAIMGWRRCTTARNGEDEAPAEAVGDPGEGQGADEESKEGRRRERPLIG